MNSQCTVVAAKEYANWKMQRSLLHDLLTCLYGNPRSLFFERSHRNCYYLCRGGGARRVEVVLTYVARLLAHLRQKAVAPQISPMEDICLYYHGVYADKGEFAKFGAFRRLSTLYAEAVEARRKWAVNVCARTRRRAWARAIFDKYIYDAAIRRLGKPGGFYERRALASGRWSMAAPVPPQVTARKRPRD